MKGDPIALRALWESIQAVHRGETTIDPVQVFGPDERYDEESREWLPEWGSRIWKLRPNRADGATTAGHLDLIVQSDHFPPTEAVEALASANSSLIFEMTWSMEFWEGAGYVRFENGRGIEFESTGDIAEGVELFRRHGWDDQANYWATQLRS